MKVQSTMLPLGEKAPDFNLLNAVTGENLSLSEISQGSKGTLVVFLANHCPFVKHIIHKLVPVVQQHLKDGLAAAFISTSDVENYPDDSPEKMKELSGILNSTIPYLYDETQDTAKSYRAMCTPDLYLFDSEQKLVYRGQFDSSRPGNDVPVTGNDLNAAITALLNGEKINTDQRPSIGCNIKWLAGKEPDYFKNLTAG